jgi:restriction endonuclease S subunit
VAGIRERPETFFRLSPAADGKAQCFAVRRGVITGRFDPGFQIPNTELPGRAGFPVRYSAKSLRSLSVEIIQPNEFIREYVDELPNAVPLLRAGNVRDGELNITDLVFVPREILAGGKKGFAPSFIHEGDILITRTGAKAGETCVVPKLNREFIISSHSIRVVPNRNIIEPKYLELFLLSRWGQGSSKSLVHGRGAKTTTACDCSRTANPTTARTRA